MHITYDMVRQSEEIRTYITQADQSLSALGFTEHSFAHVTRCAHLAAHILSELGYSQQEQELSASPRSCTTSATWSTAMTTLRPAR